MRGKWSGLLLLGLVMSALTIRPSDHLAAQAAAIDRTKPPALGAAPQLRLPAVRASRLGNGLELYVAEMHEVPVVQFTLLVPGGGRLDAARPGLASFTAGMLDEGADTLDAFGIAAQAEYLGASLGTGADWDDLVVSLKVPRRTMAPALDLMAAVALRPSFRASEVARQRDLRLAGILQQRDQPAVVAALAFDALVFPDGHPYHNPLGGDSASTAALDSAMVRAFYDRAFTPRGARLVVTGDITPAEATRLAEQFFGKWAGGRAGGQTGRRAGAQAITDTAGRPARPADRATTVFLVDKPDAAQSVIMIGNPGVARGHPDYFAIEVMNTILGGSFSSRLNTNLRETRGYTYGARSGFTYRPLPGPFVARAAVRTDVTDSSLVEFFKEFRQLRDSAVSPIELERAKQYLALGLASDFETASQIGAQLANLIVFGLPFDYYNGYVPKIMAVTAADVQRVARTYVRPDRVTIVVVGDLAKIRAPIEALRLGPVEERDMYGEAVSGKE